MFPPPEATKSRPLLCIGSLKRKVHKAFGEWGWTAACEDMAANHFEVYWFTMGFECTVVPVAITALKRPRDVVYSVVAIGPVSVPVIFSAWSFTVALSALLISLSQQSDTNSNRRSTCPKWNKNAPHTTVNNKLKLGIECHKHTGLRPYMEYLIQIHQYRWKPSRLPPARVSSMPLDWNVKYFIWDTCTYADLPFSKT